MIGRWPPLLQTHSGAHPCTGNRPRGVTGDGEPPLEAVMPKDAGCGRRCFGGLRLGEFSRGNWMAARRFEGLAPRDPHAAG